MSSFLSTLPVHPTLPSSPQVFTLLTIFLIAGVDQGPVLSFEDDSHTSSRAQDDRSHMSRLLQVFHKDRQHAPREHPRLPIPALTFRITRLTSVPNEQHIYEDRCRKPVPRFVKKIKAQHDARVAAAAARSAARAAARAAPPPRDQNTTHQVQGKTQLCPIPFLCDCGLVFPRETDLELVSWPARWWPRSCEPPG